MSGELLQFNCDTVMEGPNGLSVTVKKNQIYWVPRVGLQRAMIPIEDLITLKRLNARLFPLSTFEDY